MDVRQAQLLEEGLAYAFSQLDIRSAQGVFLDILAGNANISRLPATRSVTTLEFRGEIGVEIPQGFLVSFPQKEPLVFQTLQSVRLGASKTARVSAQCLQTGARGNVEKNLITNIVSPLEGLESVRNITPATGGKEEESDEELRQRYRKITSSTPNLANFYKRLLAIEGVQFVDIRENITLSIQDDIPPMSVVIVIEGGKKSDIGQALCELASLPFRTVGQEEVEVLNSAGRPVKYYFTRPQQVAIDALRIRIFKSSAQPLEGAFLASIKNNIKDYVNLHIGTHRTIREEELKASIELASLQNYPHEWNRIKHIAIDFCLEGKWGNVLSFSYWQKPVISCEDIFLEEDLFASSGLSKAQQGALSRTKKDIASFNLSQAKNLSSLSDLHQAKGANLERLARLLGFMGDCGAQKQDFLLYLLSQNSNGSLDFWQKAFSALGLNTSRIDIWERFSIEALLLNSHWLLDTAVLLDGEGSLNGYTRYEAYIDFLVLRSHDFSPNLQDFVNRTRYVGRRVLTREVLECQAGIANSLVYPSLENLLDASWVLDANLFLSWDDLGQVNELRIGCGANAKPPSLSDTDLSQTIYRSQRQELLKRSSSLVFQEWDWFCIKTDDPRYALADGGELKRDEYPILNQKMQELNYPYGEGDGSTTFNLPDLMSARRFVRSADKELKNIGQVQEDTMQVWESDLSDVVSGVRYEEAQEKKGFKAKMRSDFSYPNGPNHIFYVYYTLSNKEAGLRTSEENRPVNMALLPYIRVK
ncbi:UNVERIFIED_CONTAM: hypothetical protein PYX00_010893 [Menopon gallinae]|uniref:Uncharacterized protein n=1 Tax=Menopon gallinae TaxID=328185 RepID=A0AAW2H6V6_9NEOP